MQLAFKPISKADITLESLTSSIRDLLNLTFLPDYKGLNGNYQLSELERQAEGFMSMENALQEVTLDCVIAISKISMHLRNAIYNDSQVTRYEQNAKA